MIVSKIIIDVDEINQAYLNSSYPQAQKLKQYLEKEYIEACEAKNKLLGTDEFIKTKADWKEILNEKD